MSKGLEAIEQYKKVVCPTCQYNYGNGCQNKDQCFSMIIEKELKEKEQLEKDYQELSKKYHEELKLNKQLKTIKGTTTLDKALEETLIKACPNVAKKLKALEIIANECDIHFQEVAKYNIYRITIKRKNSKSGFGCSFETTKEKYDLLKEVLL